MSRLKSRFKKGINDMEVYEDNKIKMGEKIKEIESKKSSSNGVEKQKSKNLLDEARNLRDAKKWADILKKSDARDNKSIRIGQ